MNKEEILSKLKIYDPEQVPKLKRIIDMASQVDKYYEEVISDFLSPDLHHYVEYIVHHFMDVAYSLDGGYDEAEYKRLALYPDYMTEIPKMIWIVDLVYDPKYGTVGHRDVLGAVLGLGLKREVIGDILLTEGRVQIMTSENIASFLTSHLSKVGRVNVKTSIVEKDQMIEKAQDFQMIFSTVKSLRLDAVIASGYNISRSKAVDYIKADRVKLNHNYIQQTSKELSEGDLISLKGKGRIKLEKVNGLSKKERYKIQIKKYI
ncbi:hypothetical protein EZV73_21820 [Acidaminobacter sp. JC074]|uniref:YlmH family RNA-binding protein n=1 Tax=Acidaminobacter sp. JC074 TaxID=2530199 RepID=UPI001F111CC2|nr:YlmH/Sll1252 family protein [Acidaminobacter sp. JC074]MCH4890235.1 hypothetical protein [Acidaminobacter sp. JC074]